MDQYSYFTHMTVTLSVLIEQLMKATDKYKTSFFIVSNISWEGVLVSNDDVIRSDLNALESSIGKQIQIRIKCHNSDSNMKFYTSLNQFIVNGNLWLTRYFRTIGFQ